MDPLINSNTCVQNNLLSLGLGALSQDADSPNSLLDHLLKLLLEEKDGGNLVSKYNVALFIEIESNYLISSMADIEHTFATFKNVFRNNAKETVPLLQGQCLVTMTTVLLQAFEKLDEKELGVVFTEHVEFLLAIVKQTNNASNIHIRSIAASCLQEIEICFPQILKDCIENMYTSAVAETSIAHQQYMALLAVILNHSLDDNAKETALWNKYPYMHLKGGIIPHEVDSAELGHPDLKEMVSFLVDQFHFCSTEGVVWIAMQIIGMMLKRPDLQAGAQVLKPLVLHFSSTYSNLAAHIVLILEKELGTVVFQDKDNSQLLRQLLLNSCHPSLAASIRLLYLDWLNNYFKRYPHKKTDVEDVSLILPGSFDGPETLLRKLILISSLLQDKKGSSCVILQAVAILQKQLKFGSSVKLKSALIKSLYRFICDHNAEITEEIPRLVVSVSTEDILFTPFALNLIKCVQNTIPESHVPTHLITALVTTFTQPDSTATLNTFHYVLDVFLMAIDQDLDICQPKAMLNYLLKNVVCEEVCGILSWSLGHKILSLCYKLLSNYDTVEYFHELCEVLEVFMCNCEDVDLMDRAHIYHSLLVSLSNKKLKQVLVSPKQSLTSIMSTESTFHSSASVCRLDEPVLQLTKEKNLVYSKEEIITDRIQDIPEDVLKLHMRQLSFVAQKPLVIKGRLSTTSKISKDVQFIQALAVLFTAPESWGRIEPTMIGHYMKEENEKPCFVDIECFPYKPYPASVQVSAEFSIENVCYVCNLEPLSLQFPDFFQPLPVHDEYVSSPVLWKKRLFLCLWKSLEERSQVTNNAAFTSVYVLHQINWSVKRRLTEELQSYIVEEYEDGASYHIGIYLTPTNHLLMKFVVKENSTIVKIATDDIHVLAYVNNYLKNWR